MYMKEFLRSVAEHYYREAGLGAKAVAGADGTAAPSPEAMAEWLFVFPNRRSGLFFQHYLSGLSDRPMLAPQVTTLADLFQRLSGLRVADRTELLFRLYPIYKEIYLRANPSAGEETFDQFVFWGDMLLADFDDADKYLADARRLFANVRDLKEIDTLFADLPDEVLRIVRMFWTHVGLPHAEERGDDKRAVFRSTWSILYDLYTAFRSRLVADGLAYEGMMQREVAERLRSDVDAGLADLPWRKVVFVGLTAISRADRELMLALKRLGLAEFCWDYADSRLRLSHTAGAETVASQAAYFTAENLGDFPNALSDEELQAGIVPDAERQVRVFSIPSGVGQTAQARAQLLEWMAPDGNGRRVIDAASTDKHEADNAFHTAVVLPDEKLLIPMLYAVPAELEPFNVTMGYGLRATPVAALIEGIARLHQDVRGGHFYYKSVLPLLSHNYTMALAGKAARAAAVHIADEGLYLIAPERLQGELPWNDVPQQAGDEALGDDDTFMRLLFRPVTTAREAVVQLTDVLGYLQERAEAAFGDVDREFIIAYAQVVRQLGEQMESFVETFSIRTFYLLLSRLAQGVTVPFSGEPLAGLQVMGVLETRAVDFDNLVILSMNEGVFPASSAPNTFIPMSLRQAFGLPTQRHRDAVYAYHFYRLLSRARRVTLIYDARANEQQSGEPSRYVMQLRYLYGVDAPTETLSYPVGVAEPMPVEVAKTPEVMARLARFRSVAALPAEGERPPRQLSATALKAYLHCPLSFYLQYVEGLSEDGEVNEDIDARQFGDVLHDALSRLYAPLAGRSVQSDVLHRMASNEGGVLDQAVDDAFRAQMNVTELTGYLCVVREILTAYIRNVLLHDAALCPFTYMAAEEERIFDYTVSDGLTVRLKGVFDRLDYSVRDGCVRLVDYKTGSNKGLAFSSAEGLFCEWGQDVAGDVKVSGSEHAFQVMLYCLMLTSRNMRPSVDDAGKPRIDLAGRPLQPHLYYVRAFHSPDAPTLLVQGKEHPVVDFSALREDFEGLLRRMLAEIYDPTVPFRQAKDAAACAHCPFLSVCRRG